MGDEKHFKQMEINSAINFREAINQTQAKQVIYKSGVVNAQTLSDHLSSRMAVEQELSKGRYSLTTLRAGIVIGSGSSTFEIISDLVEKLPLMVAPRWLNTLSQPIAVYNAIQFLTGVLLKDETFCKSFDIGGPDVLSYKQMLLGYAKVRALKRRIWIVPVMTPKLSSYWLYFITSTSFKLAQNLVESMKVPVVCTPNNLSQRLKIELLNYDVSVRNALGFLYIQLEENERPANIAPSYGCFFDKRTIQTKSIEATMDRIWAIGGVNGWYFGTWIWQLRGWVDKLFGGIGFRKGRPHSKDLSPSDRIDFWRVLYANKSEGHLILYAEMSLPGEGWLEFKIDRNGIIHQTATFRPKGLWGRMYWRLVIPFHYVIFRGLITRLVGKN